MGLDLLVEVAELGIAVGTLLAFQGFGVGLQAETLLAQQVRDHIRTDPVTLCGQLRGEVASRSRRPPQRRHRITPLVGFHQRQQRRDKTGIIVGQSFTTTTGPTNPAQRSLPGLQLGHPERHRRLTHPGRAGSQPDPAMPDRSGLRRHRQPPLTLIQMRQQRSELRRQRRLGIL